MDNRLSVRAWPSRRYGRRICGTVTPNAKAGEKNAIMVILDWVGKGMGA